MSKESTRPDQFWLTVEEARALLGVSRAELYNRTQPGDQNYLVTKKSNSGRRLFSLCSMPFEAQQRWRQSVTQNRAESPTPSNPLCQCMIQDSSTTSTISPPSNSPPAQQSLAYPRTELERHFAVYLADLAKSDPVAVPAVTQRFEVFQPTLDHEASLTGTTVTAFMREQAKKIGPRGMHLNSLWRKRKEFRNALASGDYAAAFDTLKVNRPGPKPGTNTAFDLDPSLKAFVLMQLKSGKTVAQAQRNTLAYLSDKASALRGLWAYSAPKKPLLSAIRRLKSEATRQGLLPVSPSIRTAAGYIDRHYNDERAGDAWCMDEFELDAYPFEDSNHRIVYNYGGKNPILHLLSIVDERTTYIMDWLLTIQIDTDTLLVIERMLRNYWAPLRLVADRAKRFRELVHGHRVVRQHGELVDMVAAPLERLGVKPRDSERKNPQGNRIERMHGIYAANCRRDFGPSWRPPKRVRGLDPAERDALVEALHSRVQDHYRYHCGVKPKSPRAGEPSPLLPFSQIHRAVAAWIDEINDAPTEAKGCNGMSRRAAFNYYQTPEQEIARRKVLQPMLDVIFAERFVKPIRTGGIIEIDEQHRYDSEACLGRDGEEVEAWRYRRDPSTLYVSLEGETVQCRRRPLVGIYEEKLLAQESAILAHREKILAGALPSEQGLRDCISPPDSETDSQLASEARSWAEARALRVDGVQTDKFFSPLTTSDLADGFMALESKEES